MLVVVKAEVNYTTISIETVSEAYLGQPTSSTAELLSNSLHTVVQMLRVARYLRQQSRGYGGAER